MVNDLPPKKKAKITIRDDKAKVFWLTSLYVGNVSGAFSDDVRRVFIINLFSSVGVVFAGRMRLHKIRRVCLGRVYSSRN